MFALAAEISLRILAAAAAVGLVLVVLRVRSGAARHAAWSAVLLATLTMPGLMAIVPRVEVAVPSALALDFGGIAVERNAYEPMETPASPDFTESRPSVVVTSPALVAKESPNRLALTGELSPLRFTAPAGCSSSSGSWSAGFSGGASPPAPSASRATTARPSSNLPQSRRR
jgi:hypothetical protein